MRLKNKSFVYKSNEKDVYKRQAINQAGPGGALVAYLIMGAIVYTMIIALIEMASFLPVAGAFKEYPKRFLIRRGRLQMDGVIGLDVPSQ